MQDWIKVKNLEKIELLSNINLCLNFFSPLISYIYNIRGPRGNLQYPWRADGISWLDMEICELDQHLHIWWKVSYGRLMNAHGWVVHHSFQLPSFSLWIINTHPHLFIFLHKNNPAILHVLCLSHSLSAPPSSPSALQILSSSSHLLLVSLSVGRWFW